jgi:hypothetical protein
LKPRKKLNLPEHSVVEIRVRTAKQIRVAGKSLFGAFPELAVITDADIRDVKEQWNKSVQKQSRLLKEKENKRLCFRYPHAVLICAVLVFWRPACATIVQTVQVYN